MAVRTVLKADAGVVAGFGVRSEVTVDISTAQYIGKSFDANGIQEEVVKAGMSVTMGTGVSAGGAVSADLGVN